MAKPNGSHKNRRKKIIERRFLEAARGASAIIPDGEIECFEKPDFKITTATGALGVEVAELLRAGASKRPVAVQREFEEVVRLAREKYHHSCGATSKGVTVHPSGRENPSKKSRGRMAHALAKFVSLHQTKVSAGNPVVYLEDREKLPDGFLGIIEINLTGNWISGEVGGATNHSEIREELALVISDHNKHLPGYRKNLPGCPIWLLVYSRFEVARGVSIPHDFSEWSFPFEFEKVLFFSCLDNNKVVEIPKGPSGETRDK